MPFYWLNIENEWKDGVSFLSIVKETYRLHLLTIAKLYQESCCYICKDDQVQLEILMRILDLDHPSMRIYS